MSLRTEGSAAGRALLEARRGVCDACPMSAWQRWRVEYYCALLVSAVLLPGAAALLTSALYLDRHRLFLNGTGSRSLGAGIGLAVLAWLVLSPFLCRFAYPARAIPTVYDELHTEYDELLSLSQAFGSEDRATAAGVAAARSRTPG